jgi:hemerythrin HHE cation binding domain-containing protein
MTIPIAIPRTLRAEHRELHHELARAAESGGRTGEAARQVAALLHPHFVKEEEFALPPLALLAAIAKGKPVADAGSVIAMTDRLRTQFAELVREHDEIVRALQNLIATAKADERPDIVRFAEQLVLHAETEEEVLYPAAILVGEYLKVKRT